MQLQILIKIIIFIVYVPPLQLNMQNPHYCSQLAEIWNTILVHDSRPIYPTPIYITVPFLGPPKTKTLQQIWNLWQVEKKSGKHRQTDRLMDRQTLVYYNMNIFQMGIKKQFHQVIQWWPIINELWGTLTLWGQVMHICVSKLTIIGSDNGLSPGRRQYIIWTNAGILLIRISGTNSSEILSEIYSRKGIWKCLKNGGHFVAASMS